jgi:hypothetical protein
MTFALEMVTEMVVVTLLKNVRTEVASHPDLVLMVSVFVVSVRIISIFTHVCTYVQRGSKFCFVVVADTLHRILHYCPCFTRQP